jgi:hypothetical protein
MKQHAERCRRQGSRHRAGEPAGEAGRARIEGIVEPSRRRERFIEADLLDREECLHAFGEEVREGGSALRRHHAEVLADVVRYKRRPKPAITTNNERDHHDG